jgi:hypothetical protein
MTIKIRKRRFMDGGASDPDRFIMTGLGKHPPQLTLYVVTQDGRRVDSFLYYKNALRKAAQLRTDSALQLKEVTNNG